MKTELLAFKGVLFDLPPDDLANITTIKNRLAEIVGESQSQHGLLALTWLTMELVNE